MSNMFTGCTPPPRKVTPRKNTEKHVEDAIREAFRLKFGILLFKTDAGGAGMRQAASEGFRGSTGLPAGFPDLLGCVGPVGRCLVIEVKAPGCKPTENQRHYLTLFAKAGAISFWADSVNSAIEQFEEQNKEINDERRRLHKAERDFA